MAALAEMERNAAAFGRLCVETMQQHFSIIGLGQPPSGGCVLKRTSPPRGVDTLTAAAFGRLCVETTSHLGQYQNGVSSRLRAAVC